MSGDYLSNFLSKCKPDDKTDNVLNLLIQFIITTDKSLSDETRKTYQTLQLLINGKADPKDMDPDSMQLIREAYDELIEEMSSVEFDVESIKELVTPEALDSL